MIELPDRRDMAAAAHTLDLVICWLEDQPDAYSRGLQLHGLRDCYQVLVDLAGRG